MTKIVTQEQKVAQKHPVAFPIYVVGALMLVAILVLVWFLYQTVAENTRLKQKYQQNTNSIDNYENSQDQQLNNSLEDL